MFLTVFYELALWILALIMFPKMIYQMIMLKKYRKTFFKRFGYGFPTIDKAGRPLVWIHAISFGETKAVAPLVKKIKENFGNPIVLISSITETGHAEAKRIIPEADYHVFLPFDFYFIMKRIMKKAAPDWVFLCETDFWYNFLRLSKAQGAAVSVVNAKISARSMDRFGRFPRLTRSLFAPIDFFCVQNTHYQKRFEEIGISAKKMRVTGNLKFDDQPIMMTDLEKNEMKQRFGIHADDKILVIGSTHDPEESLLLKVLLKIWPNEPHLKVIIAPRHPQRFDQTALILKEMDIPFVRYSSEEIPAESSKVVLLDAMGLLAKIYQIADIAIVAGSYTDKVGGHNILEPLWYGVPVVFGPHMHGQPELCDLVLQYKAGVQATVDSLEKVLADLLVKGPKTEELQSASLQLIADMQGSVQRTYDQLCALTKIEQVKI